MASDSVSNFNIHTNSAFQGFTAHEQLQIALQSSVHAAQVREANLGRCSQCGTCPPRLTTLVITSWNNWRNTARAMEPLSLASKPSIRHLRTPIGDGTLQSFPRCDADTVTERNTLLLKNPLLSAFTETEIVTAITTAFPTITELQFFSTTPAQWRILVRLLQNQEWAGRLTSLTMHYFLPGASKEEEEAIVRPLFEALNNGGQLPALRRLALNWQSAHLVLPELPLLSRLQVMALNLGGQQHPTKDDPDPVPQPQYAPSPWAASGSSRVVQWHQGPPNPPDLAHFFRSLERYAAANGALQVHFLISRRSLANLGRLSPALAGRLVRVGVSEESLDSAVPRRGGSRYPLRYHRLDARPWRYLVSPVGLSSSPCAFTALRSLSMGVLERRERSLLVAGRHRKSLRFLFDCLHHLAPQLVHLELTVAFFLRPDGGGGGGSNQVEEEGAGENCPPPPPPPPAILPTVRALDMRLYHNVLGDGGHRRVVSLGRQLQWALPALETLHLLDYYCRDCLERSSPHHQAQQARQCLQATLTALCPRGVLAEEEEEGEGGEPVPNEPVVSGPSSPRRPRLLLDYPLAQFSFSHMVAPPN